MISQIYRGYFQKSHTFLFPLLGFKKNARFKPEQTYISWTGIINPQDRRLVCVYKREDSEAWKSFESDILIAHKMLDYCVPIDDNTVVYVFDFNSMKEDFDAFLNGKFSTFSSSSKKAITEYYGTHTPEWVYIESFLFPAKYYKQYAEILNLDVNLLQDVVELCEKYDEQKEQCELSTSPDIPATIIITSPEEDTSHN